MNRRLTITAAAWASQDAQGRLWLVGERDDEWTWLPPAEFVQACAPCEADGTSMECDHKNMVWHPGGEVFRKCETCSIKLVGPCYGDPWCYGCERGHVLGYAYVVGQPLPIEQVISDVTGPGLEVYVGTSAVRLVADPNQRTLGLDLTNRLAHYGPPESLVGKWAMCIEVKKERT